MNKILITLVLLTYTACSAGVSSPEVEVAWKADKIVDAFDKSGRKIADTSNRYYVRLERVINRIKEVSTKEVYIDTKIDLFMLGTHLRVNSGLMDLMRDDELLSLIVKEYAHNKLGHYENRFASVTDGYEKALENSFTESQNSSADAFTLNYFYQNKLNSQAVVNAAYKLAKLEEKVSVSGADMTFSTRIVNKSSIDRARALASMLQESKTNDQYLIGLIQNEQVTPVKKEVLAVKEDIIEEDKMLIQKPAIETEQVVAEIEQPEPEKAVIKIPEKVIIPETKISKPASSTSGIKTASINSKKKVENSIQQELKANTVAPGWYLQVSAEDNKDSANEKIHELSDASLKGAVQETSVDGKKFYRVLIGPYESKADLAQAKKSNLVRTDSFARYVE